MEKSKYRFELIPCDEELVYKSVKKHGKCLVLTEECIDNFFAQSLSAKIQENCFEFLDAPVFSMGAENLPAIPLNSNLERNVTLTLIKYKKIAEILNY